MKKNVLISLFGKIGLNTETINQLSVRTGFIQRSRMIRAVEFLIYMITESVRGCVSCNDLATAIQFEAGTMASRQAYIRWLKVWLVYKKMAQEGAGG